jgi:hypothetical protein
VLINLINQKGAEAVIGKEYEKQVRPSFAEMRLLNATVLAATY